MDSFHNELIKGAAETEVEKAFWKGCYCGIALTCLCLVFISVVIG